MRDTPARQRPESSVFSRMSFFFGLDLNSQHDVLRLVGAGIPTRSCRRALEALGIPAEFVGAKSTMRRRMLAPNSKLNEAESERLIRLVRVDVESVEMFGDEKAARSWLMTPQSFLPDADPISPMRLATMEVGARLVESHLRRTMYGHF